MTLTNKTVQNAEKLVSYIGQSVLSVNGHSVNVHIVIWMPDAIFSISIPKPQRFIAQ